MKYFAIFASIILGFAVLWVVFFSGLILNKDRASKQYPVNSFKAEEKATSTAETKLDESLTNTIKKEETKDNHMIIMETNFGTIKIAVDHENTPKTSENFEKLVENKFYDGLTFHRIIPGFVIQGGDPKGDGTGGPGYTVPAEIKLLHKRGVIATARTGDAVNPLRASSGSQFYIALADLPDLDAGGYTVFGRVTSGMDVVDKIAHVNTDSSDKPTTPVQIIRAYIEAE